MKKMKKTLFTIICIMSVFAYASAQTLVTTTPQNRNVVLEEYTGIHCQYCPQGHQIAEGILADNPGKVVLINIHQGSFAVPGSGEPDFRTSFGDALAGQTGLTGYPSGTVNRHVYADWGANTALGRDKWTAAAGRILAMPSPVNIGVSSSFNAGTRLLTVTVELYYTANSAQSTNYINVALLQSNILGPQTGGGMGNNYVHKHMLRHLITGQWGDAVTTTTSGTFVTRTYTYTVPASYTSVPCDIANCDIAVFVTESHQEILNGTQVVAVGGTTLPVGNVNYTGASYKTGNPSATTSFSYNVASLLPGTQSFVFTLTPTGQPAGWNSSFVINGNTYTSTATVDITNGTPLNVTFNVTPNTDAGFPTYKFTIQSVSNPMAPVLTKEFYVISNVTDMVLHNQGSWGGGKPSDFETVYFDGLTYAGCTTFASSNYNKFIGASADNALTGVGNIYFNCGWTSPTFTDQDVAIFTTFLNGGGRLFVAGQDIGWNTWDAAGSGTVATKAFYTNYLNSSYVNDGSTTNNSVYPFATDLVFGTMGNSTFNTNLYGSGNFYPDQIAPVGNGSAITYYANTPTKISGVKSTNGTYKTVYIGFDPSMMTDANVQKEFFNKTHDWFHGIISDIDLIENNQNDFISYPNPCSDFTTIVLNNRNINDLTIQIVDLFGRTVQTEKNTNNSNLVKIDVSNLANGIYYCRILDNNSTLLKTSKIQVIK